MVPGEKQTAAFIVGDPGSAVQAFSGRLSDIDRGSRRNIRTSKRDINWLTADYVI
jgi:hypothetical protein